MTSSIISSTFIDFLLEEEYSVLHLLLYQCEFLFHPMDYISLLSLFILKIKLSRFGQWEPFQAGSWVLIICPHHCLNIYLLSSIVRCSRLILTCSLPLT